MGGVCVGMGVAGRDVEDAVPYGGNFGVCVKMAARRAATGSRHTAC